MAEKEPSLIKRIADDGHEIGCHSYFHESLKGKDDEIFENTLRRLRMCLNQPPRKKFSVSEPLFLKIEKSNPSQYKILEKIFTYDSSFYCQDKSELDKFISKMGLTNLKIIPITSKNLFGKNFRLGGSYLKLLPEILSRNIFKTALENKIAPHLYLHPYEFENSKEFAIDNIELKNLSLKRKYYWKLRQKIMVEL